MLGISNIFTKHDKSHSVSKNNRLSLVYNLKQTKMIRTTSLKRYKELKAKGINVELVTKRDLN